jgi:hypothetical protein
MPISPRQLATFVAVALTASGLWGCGTVNGYLASGLSDVIPQWAGGLPADAPPRPGSEKYEEFMRERERKRLEPASAPAKDETRQTLPSSLDAVH